MIYVATARELYAAFVKEAATMALAIAPTTPPSIHVRTYANVFLALDVAEANRALELGVDERSVAFTLAARKMAWQYGASAVRDAITHGLVDDLLSRRRTGTL